MSEIVKRSESIKDVVPAASDVISVFAAKAAPGYVLDPAKPMPLDYSQRWDTLIKWVKSKDKGSDKPAWSKITGISLRKFKKYPTSVFAVTSPVLGGFIGFVASIPILASGLVDTNLYSGIVAPLCAATAFSVIPLAVLSDGYQKIISRATDTLGAEYNNRVAEWALKRYGVTLDAEWVGSGERTGKDMAYVGEKDGKRVYCYETPSGWVLGDFTGELPVLANDLVGA